MQYMINITIILIRVYRYYLDITFLNVHDLISTVCIKFSREKTHYIGEKWYTTTKSSLTPKRNTDESWWDTEKVFTSCWVQIFFQNRSISTPIDAPNKTRSHSSAIFLKVFEFSWPNERNYCSELFFTDYKPCAKNKIVGQFLDTSLHLYKRVCPSVGWMDGG